MAGFKRCGSLRRTLGTHKTGPSCLDLRSLADVNLGVLEELITESVQYLPRTHA